MILEQIKQNAELTLGEPVTEAVITVPAYFSQRQKDATREAGKLAGLRVARILNEPTAAALAFGLDLEEDETQQVLVYDLGGGTFDVSIMMVSSHTFDVFNYDGDNFLGGDNFDGLIVEQLFMHLQHRYGVDLRASAGMKDQLKQIAEQAKIALSLQPQTHLLAEQLETVDGIPINLDLTLTRTEFEAWIAPLVDRTLEIVTRALRGAHMTYERYRPRVAGRWLYIYSPGAPACARSLPGSRRDRRRSHAVCRPGRRRHGRYDRRE